MSAIQDAARRLAEQLPQAVAACRDAHSAAQIRKDEDYLASILAAFGEACAGRDDAEKDEEAYEAAMARARARFKSAPPPVDIRLTAEELTAAIECIEASGPLREIDRAALAKLRAARGTR